ncbi:MAG: EF-P lysine aminoacylase GenX [Gammaproteobacteria bacterium RIFCSPHIGHO2_12_FULL_45_9]|nr:MAG: EF-P lysine aminoacylase GenX [Gammaproteobacteria bacterium RIFCSPHIGHO2_12_FULL_45_9]
MTVEWRPSAAQEVLQARARFLKKIRAFFEERGVCEVDTPLLCQYAVTDPHIDAFEVPVTAETTYFLQTSPEYAMKRLLAAGSGPIYQMCKAFRRGEVGRLHNPEFTMLEWYRPLWDHHALMDEMDAFLNHILCTPPAERVTYLDLFQQYVGIDPHTMTVEALRHVVERQGIMLAGVAAQEDFTRDTYLELLMSHIIEPHLGVNGVPTFVHDFPASQSALAKLRRVSEVVYVAERFEVFLEGAEWANGFHELTDADEQRARFVHDQQARQACGLPFRAIDHRLLAALPQLPHCAGVALGVDRLFLRWIEKRQLSEVLSFDWLHA